MPIFKKRNLKIKWRLLLTSIPIALVPLSIILWFYSVNIIDHFEKQKTISNDTIIYQIGKSVEKSYQDNISKIANIISLQEVKDNIYIDKFKNNDEENLNYKKVEGFQNFGKGIKRYSGG